MHHGGIMTYDKFKNIINKKPSELKYETLDLEIEIHKTFVDMSYQRELTKTLANNIAENFNWKKFGRPLVSSRDDDTFAILDGQTRINGAKMNNYTKVPCVVYFDLTIEEEASLYTSHNTEHKTPSKLELFKSGIRANKKEDVAIALLLKKHGIPVGTSNAQNQLGCIELVRKGYRANIDHMDQTLGFINDVYDSGTTNYMYQSYLVHSVYSFISYRHILESKSEITPDMERFKDVLSRQHPRSLTNEIKKMASVGIQTGLGGTVMQFSDTRGGSTTGRDWKSNTSRRQMLRLHPLGLLILIQWYNKGLRGNKKLSTDWILDLPSLAVNYKEVLDILNGGSNDS